MIGSLPVGNSIRRHFALFRLRVCQVIAGFAVWLVAVGQAAPETPRRFALLVGATRYPNLPDSFQLEGPANDVTLMWWTLTDRFGVPSDNIAVLSEALDDDAQRPTRANIEREFAHLAGIAGRGDQVLILLAGHGSQQPDQSPPDPNDPEPDGLDEIYLPSDVGKWDGDIGTVKNALVDDELHAWLARLTKRGAFVWFIVDACHSGTVLRGGSAERLRRVPPTVLAPAQVLAKAHAAASERSRGSSTSDEKPEDDDLAGTTGEWVAIYAAQSTEPTVEKMLPPGSPDQESHGILSYTLCRTLAKARSPLSYAELVQEIQRQYAAWGRTFPTPLVEGGGQDREVFGSVRWPQRSLIRLRAGKSPDHWKVNAGSLVNLTPGSILEIHPAAGEGESDQVVGFVEVTHSQALEADVRPIAYQDRPAPASLPDGGRCEPAFTDFGDLRLRVSATAGTGAARETTVRLAGLRNDLRQAAGRPGSIMSWVDETKDADWIVEVGPQHTWLVPGSGLLKSMAAARNRSTEKPATDTVFGPVATGAEMGPWVEERLRRIARAQNLLALAAAPAETSIESDVNVTLELRRVGNKNGKPTTPVPWNETGRTLHPGERVAFSIENCGRSACDVTLLFIDSLYGIHAFYPQRGRVEDNRLPPGGKSLSPTAEVTDATVGLEHAVAIAVRAEGAPVDFTILEQPAIESAARTRGGDQRLASPLGRLLCRALYGEGATRGLVRTAVSDYTVRALSWRVTSESK